jgi:hydroxypyruvate isomerase
MGGRECAEEIVIVEIKRLCWPEVPMALHECALEIVSKIQNESLPSGYHIFHSQLA